MRGKTEAEFAINCRKVRLFLRDNPNSTNTQIFRGVGFKPGDYLMKMLTMGIVGYSHDDGEVRTHRWFVIPQ